MHHHRTFASRLASAMLGTLLLAVGTAQAQKSILNEELDRATGTRVQVRSVFDPLPPSGYAPMRVVGTNGTARQERWSFDFVSQISAFRQANKHASSFVLDVPGRSTQSALYLVPLAASYGDPAYSNGSHSLTLSVDGTGFSGQSGYDNDSRIHGFPAVALSVGLAEFSIAALNKEVESKLRGGGGFYGGRADLFGSQFEPDDLAESWLGLSGFDYLLLSSTDWQKLRPGVKRAVLEWMHLGGTLHVFLSGGVTSASLGLPGGEFTGTRRFSLGKVETFVWDGKKLSATETVGRYWGASKRVDDLLKGHTSAADWPLPTLLGTRSYASWQVIVFLVVFGLLVGPVNLFVLAPAGKRHKLFVTTPLLSISASLVMIVLILAQDGTGGMGQRLVLVDLQPEEAAAYVTQEQISRTGVLLGGAFEIKQPALLEPLALPESPWAKLKSSDIAQGVDLTQEGSQRRGNFFQSRAEQGQVLRASVPTRARLELKAGTQPGEAPTLISALGFTVDELGYTDAAGEAWMLKEPLSTGQSATLVKTDAAALLTQRTDLVALAGEDLRQRFKDHATDARGFFFAKARKAPGFTLETLSAIRWNEDHVVVFGPLLQP